MQCPTMDTGLGDDGCCSGDDGGDCATMGRAAGDDGCDRATTGPTSRGRVAATVYKGGKLVRDSRSD